MQTSPSVVEPRSAPDWQGQVLETRDSDEFFGVRRGYVFVHDCPGTRISQLTCAGLQLGLDS